MLNLGKNFDKSGKRLPGKSAIDRWTALGSVTDITQAQVRIGGVRLQRGRAIAAVEGTVNAFAFEAAKGAGPVTEKETEAMAKVFGVLKTTLSAEEFTRQLKGL